MINKTNAYVENKYICDHCKRKLNHGWSYEEAMKEYGESSYYDPNEKLIQVCDDCFQFHMNGIGKCLKC